MASNDQRDRATQTRKDADAERNQRGTVHSAEGNERERNGKRSERDQAERESDALMQDRRLREQDGTSPEGGKDPTTGQSDGDREHTRRNVQPPDAGQGSGEKERPIEGVGRSKTSDR